ncbi:MAG: NapC/NirT family cytochrome c [Chloroflexi bacterium]|nr:NapC/NirT family cytochrome c [Chloroflexota bacterium]
MKDKAKRLVALASRRKKLALAVVLGMGFFGIVPVMLLAGNQAVQMVDSTLFCTQVCHSVHYTEAVTIKQSGHPDITCAGCHVGSGTRNLIKSKIKGLSEILPTIKGDYVRPIPTLLQNQLPSAETCQTCHSPNEYAGDMPVIKAAFAADKHNTRSIDTLVLKLNGGRPETSSGIHWHSTANIWYMAFGNRPEDIAWVASEDPSGEITQYVDPNLIGRLDVGQIQSGKRMMDCVDCHNRVAHPVRSTEELVDRAMAEGIINVKLPFIKLVAVNALNAQNVTVKSAEQRIDQIKDFYRTNYPDIFRSEGKSIDHAIASLKDIAILTTLPNGTNPSTYPDNNVHNRTAADGTVDFASLARQGLGQGCFRCHGTLVKVSIVRSSPLVQEGTKNRKEANIDSALRVLDIARIKEELSHDNSGGDGTSISASAAPAISESGIMTVGLKSSARADNTAPASRSINSNGNLPNSLDADCNLCHYAQTSTSFAGGPHTLPLAPVASHPVDGLDNCLVCHNPSGPQPFKNTHSWATNGACLACHQLASDPKGLPVEAPPEAPETPHSKDNLDNCLVCHGPTGPKPFKADHAWVTNQTCDACHALSSNPRAIPEVKPPKAPETPHSVEKLDNCLICHSPKGPKAMKPDHAWVTNQTCSACHRLSQRPVPIKVVAPADVPQTPHLTAGLENCLVCHSPVGPKPFKNDHPWVTDDTCGACHETSKNPRAIQVMLPANVPQIPHLKAGLETCLACHGPMGPKAFKPGHPWATDAVCAACHKSSPSPVALKPGTLPPSPNIPHSITGLGNCSACHYSGGPGPFVPDHIGRPDSLCMICHKSTVKNLPPATLPVAPNIPHSITGLASCSICHHSEGSALFSATHAGRPDSFCLICHKPAVSQSDIGFYHDAAATQPVTTLELGNVVQGTSRSTTFYVKNTGAVPVIISQGSGEPTMSGTLTMNFEGVLQRTLAPGEVSMAVASFQSANDATPGDLNFPISVDFVDAPFSTSTPMPGAPSGPVSYATIIQPLFNASCISCHGPGGSSGINLASYSATIATAGVVVGNAGSSLLYKSVAGTGVPMMPPGGGLTPVQVAAIQTWINQGAANN